MPGGGSALPGMAGGGSGSLESRGHRVEDFLAELALGDAAAEAAGARQLLDRLRRVRGDLQHGFVLHDPAARQVALLRRRLAPRRDGLQHAEKPPVGRAAQPEAPPCLFRVGAVDRRIDQILHLLGEPAGAAVLAEDLLQPLIDRAQMDRRRPART